jgi:hypothetical protein
MGGYTSKCEEKKSKSLHPNEGIWMKLQKKEQNEGMGMTL